jgi:uncharacterized protein YcsI (UPF0317 family)
MNRSYLFAPGHNDLVAFRIGCSFTFENRLTAAGVPLRHLEQKVNASMYITNRQCRPAGRLHGPLVVSMRPIPRRLIALATSITGQMPAVHGSPVQVGSPAELGVQPDRPDFGDPVQMHDGDVPVFWACGVTPPAALMASRPPFAITHSPGYMLVTDVPDAQHIISLPLGRNEENGPR